MKAGPVHEKGLPREPFAAEVQRGQSRSPPTTPRIISKLWNTL